MIRFLRYSFFGLFGVLSDTLIYSLLISFQFNFLIANIIGHLTGTFFSFYLNRTFNFNKFDKSFLRFFLFLFISIIGLITSSVIIYLLVNFNNFDPIFSKIISLPFVLVLQFSLNKQVTFKI